MKTTYHANINTDTHNIHTHIHRKHIYIVANYIEFKTENKSSFCMNHT